MKYQKFLNGEIPNINEAIELSKKFDIPIHPNYTFYFNELSSLEFIEFLKIFKKINFENFSLINEGNFKRYLEIVGVPHRIKSIENKILFDEEVFLSLILNFGSDIKDYKKYINNFIDKLIILVEKNLDKKTYDLINLNSKFKFVDKGGTYIGCRMGRPEKAKPRDLFKVDGKKLKAHGIFPCGYEGGRFLNIIEAYKKFGKITSDFEIFFDEEKNYEGIYRNEGKDIFFDRYDSNKKSLELKKDYVKFKKKNY